MPAHQGPVGARRYHYSARNVAAALIRVGTGDSYRSASLLRAARRLPLPRRPRRATAPNRLGQLVADCVEAFAPVMFERFRRYEWPATGSVVLDHLPLRVKALNEHGRLRLGGEVAFDVFAATGYEGDRPVFLRIEAFPDASTDNWVHFLRGGALTRQPRAR